LPTFVRDVYFNACGYADAEFENDEEVNVVCPSHMAGFGVKIDVYDDIELWRSFNKKLIQIGDGKYVDGMKKIIKEKDNE